MKLKKRFNNWLYKKIIYLRCYFNLSVYNSIYDMPQWNWDMLNKTGSMLFFLKKNYYENIEDKYSNKLLEKRYYKIADQLLSKYGLSDTRLNILKKQERRRKFQIDYILNGNKSLLNEINMLNIDIEELEESNDNIMDYDEVIPIIEKYQGVKIDIIKITIAEYHNYLNNISKYKKAS